MGPEAGDGAVRREALPAFVFLSRAADATVHSALINILPFNQVI